MRAFSLYPGSIPWLELGVKRADFLKVSKSSARATGATLRKEKKQTLAREKRRDEHTQEERGNAHL